MTRIIDHQDPAIRSMTEGAEWRLLGLCLERPRPGWREEIAALTGEVRDASLKNLRPQIDRATEGEYLAILGPGGIVSPREVSYRPMEDPGQVFVDLQAFYQAFRFEPRIEEPIDHIATETAFLGYLKLKEAFAFAQGDIDSASTATTGIEGFIASHYGGFCTAFAGRLESRAESYLNTVAAALCARIGRPAADPEAPFQA